MELGIENGVIVTRTDSLGAGLTKQIAYSKEPGDLGDQYNAFLDCEEVTADNMTNGDVIVNQGGKMMRPKRLPSNLYQFKEGTGEARCVLDCVTSVYNNSPSFNWTLNFRQQVYDAMVEAGKDVSAYDRAKLMSVDYDETELGVKQMSVSVHSKRMAHVNVASSTISSHCQLTTLLPCLRTTWLKNTSATKACWVMWLASSVKKSAKASLA